MSSQMLTTTLRQHYDSHAEDCACFLCACHRAAIKELGGRCPEHGVVRAVCLCARPEELPA
jgi:hypothetical protein